MRSMLVVAAVAVWTTGLAFAEGDAGEKKPKPGGPALAAEAKPAVEPEAEKKIKEVLKTKKVTFDFVDVPVADAMEFMRQLVGVNMVLGPDVDRKATLTLKGNDMAAGQALQWMAKMADAKLEVRDGAVAIEHANDGEREFAPKPKPEKGFAKLDLEKLRHHGGAPLGKAVIPLGNGASVELNLEEEDLDPETRQVLLKLLRQQLLKELEKQDPKAAVEFKAAMERRAKLEADERARGGAEDARRALEEARERFRDKIREKMQKLPKPGPPEGRGEDGKAQF